MIMTTHQNLCDATEAVFGGKFAPLSTHPRKEESLQIVIKAPTLRR